MKRSKIRVIVALLGLGSLVGPGAGLNSGAAQGSSTRYTIRCNVDGSYDCANSACNGQFCCQYGGVYAE